MLSPLTKNWLGWPLLLPAGLSGFAVLGLEMLWIERIEYLFGNTVEAAGAVITIFFLAAALGNVLGGRLAARFPGANQTLLVWALCHLATGLVAAILWRLDLPWLVKWLPEGLQALTASLLLAGLPSLLLGVNFPLLGSLRVHWEQSRKGQARGLCPTAGQVYAVELTGATLAIGICGIWLPAVADYPRTLTILSGLLLTGAALAFAVGLFAGKGASPGPEAGKGDQLQGRHKISMRSAALYAGVSGFLTLAFEMVVISWFRHIFGFSLLAYGGALVLFLAGLASGTALVTWLRRRGQSVESLLILSLLGASVALTSSAIGVQIMITQNPGLVGGAVWSLLLPGFSIIAGILFAGMVFPLSWDLVKTGTARTLSPGQVFGRLTGLNKLASAAGALGATFVLIPVVGIQKTAMLLAVFYAASTLPVIGSVKSALASGAGRTGKITGLALALALVPLALFLVPFHPIHVPEDTKLLDVDYGRYGSVAVLESAEPSRRIVANNRYTLNGTSAALVTQRNQAWVPLALALPENPEILILGMGSGITAAAALDFSTGPVDVVELAPEIARVAEEWFAPWNSALFTDPRVSIHLTDGRHFLGAATPAERRWDVVICDLFLPDRPGARYFYSTDFFRAAHERLSENGVFCLWLPIYQLTPELTESIIATFHEIFPEGAVIRANTDPIQPVLGLVASTGTNLFGGTAVQSLPEPVRQSGSLFFRSEPAFRLVYIAGTGQLAPDADRALVQHNSLRFTLNAALAEPEKRLRTNAVLHWLTDSFGTDRSQNPWARAARAGNHYYAAQVQLLPIPDATTQQQAKRQARAFHHLHTAANLYPEARNVFLRDMLIPLDYPAQ